MEYMYKSGNCIIIFACVNTTSSYTELRNHRIQKLAWNWTGLCTYIRKNSGICLRSPFYRVAIDWRRKGINRQLEANNFNNEHTPQVRTTDWFRSRHSWILRDAIYVRSENEKIVWPMTLYLLAWKVEIRLTDKICYSRGSIAMELVP